VMKIKKD